MSSLHPDDRLDEDLYAQLLANPDLFLAIEQEFGVKTNVMDWALHEPEVQNLTTFRDLVKYVEGKLSSRDRLHNQQPQLTGDARGGE